MDHHEPIHPTADEPSAWTALPGQPHPTVWRARPAEQPGCLTPGVAKRLLTEHTRRGGVVLDLDDDIAFAATAAVTGRRSHALGGQQYLAAMSHTADCLDLILIHWPRPAVDPQWLLTACWSLLAATGCVVIAVEAGTDQRVAHLRAVAGAAAAAGLHTAEHVAVLTPDPASARHLAPEAATPVAGADPRHLPPGRHTACLPATTPAAAGAAGPHLDLLILVHEEAGDE